MRVILVVLMLVVVCGCASVGNSRLGSETSVHKAVEASATKDDIVKKYGRPTSVFTKDKREVYEYKYICVAERPTSYIPLLGYFMYGHSYSVRFLYVYFDDAGNVVDYKTVYRDGNYKS